MNSIEMGIKSFEEAKEMVKKSIRAELLNHTREWKEIKSLMEDIKYELWKELK